MDSSLTKTIEIYCSSCRGSGVFHGLAEASGVGIVCRDCQGSGKRTHTYVPFAGKNERHDITVVYAERPDFFSVACSHGDSVPYKDFLEGKIPEKNKVLPVHLEYSN